MPLVSIEVKNIYHPLVKSFHLKQDFRNPRKVMKVLLIETSINLSPRTDRTANKALLGLLADLEGILKEIERRTGKIDCVDICPARPVRDGEYRISA